MVGTAGSVLGREWCSRQGVLRYRELPLDVLHLDVVEAHCYFVDIGRTDHEQIRSRINNNDSRTFRPRRPLSTAYKTFRYCIF